MRLTRWVVPNREAAVFLPLELIRVLANLDLDFGSRLLRRIGRQDLTTICGKIRPSS